MVEVQGKNSSVVNAPLRLENDLSESYCIPSEFRGLIFIKYLDHVIFNRASALVMKPQVREAVGWLVYECDYYVTLTWDRDAEPPTLKGGDPKASGLVLLKTDIKELKRLEPLQNNSYCHLNSASANNNSEYALQPKGRKTQTKQKGETAK
jgi:hypothetical protein